jgi:ribonuclease HI
MDYASLV